MKKIIIACILSLGLFLGVSFGLKSNASESSELPLNYSQNYLTFDAWENTTPIVNGKHVIEQYKYKGIYPVNGVYKVNANLGYNFAGTSIKIPINTDILLEGFYSLLDNRYNGFQDGQNIELSFSYLYVPSDSSFDFDGYPIAFHLMTFDDVWDTFSFSINSNTIYCARYFNLNYDDLFEGAYDDIEFFELEFLNLPNNNWDDLCDEFYIIPTLRCFPVRAYKNNDKWYPSDYELLTNEVAVSDYTLRNLNNCIVDDYKSQRDSLQEALDDLDTSLELKDQLLAAFDKTIEDLQIEKNHLQSDKEQLQEQVNELQQQNATLQDDAEDAYNNGLADGKKQADKKIKELEDEILSLKESTVPKEEKPAEEKKSNDNLIIISSSLASIILIVVLVGLIVFACRKKR